MTHKYKFEKINPPMYPTCNATLTGKYLYIQVNKNHYTVFKVYYSETRKQQKKYNPCNAKK